MMIYVWPADSLLIQVLLFIDDSIRSMMVSVLFSYWYLLMMMISYDDYSFWGDKLLFSDPEYCVLIIVLLWVHLIPCCPLMQWCIPLMIVLHLFSSSSWKCHSLLMPVVSPLIWYNIFSDACSILIPLYLMEIHSASLLYSWLDRKLIVLLWHSSCHSFWESLIWWKRMTVPDILFSVTTDTLQMPLYTFIDMTYYRLPACYHWYIDIGKYWWYRWREADGIPVIDWSTILYYYYSTIVIWHYVWYITTGWLRSWPLDYSSWHYYSLMTDTDILTVSSCILHYLPLNDPWYAIYFLHFLCYVDSRGSTCIVIKLFLMRLLLWLIEKYSMHCIVYWYDDIVDDCVAIWYMTCWWWLFWEAISDMIVCHWCTLFKYVVMIRYKCIFIILF